MFEQLFDKAVCSTGDVGATSGSVRLRPILVAVGDTIYADFAWLDAQKLAGRYAIMGIIDPTDNTRAAYTEFDNATGSCTLDCIVDMVGTWTAKILVWSGYTWLVYIDTIEVIQVDTSGSVRLRPILVAVGDTIYADFVWLNAQYHSLGYAIMVILNPAGAPRVSHYEKDDANGSCTLDCIANVAGTWTAELNVWDGSNWLIYTDTVTVISVEGEADIVAVNAPLTFTPGIAFSIYVEILNVGDAADYLFAKLTNVDTGEVLYEATSDTLIGLNTKWIQAMGVTLTQTTDFHGLLEAGHITGQSGVSLDIFVPRR